MNAELMSLKDRRNDLTKELALLSEREEVLRAKTHVLAKMLDNRSIGTPKQAAKRQEGLETAEGFVEERDRTEEVDRRTPPVTPDPHRNQLSSINDSKLTQVRLKKKNAIFSWRYTRLP